MRADARQPRQEVDARVLQRRLSTSIAARRRDDRCNERRSARRRRVPIFCVALLDCNDAAVATRSPPPPPPPQRPAMSSANRFLVSPPPGRAPIDPRPAAVFYTPPSRRPDVCRHHSAAQLAVCRRHSRSNRRLSRLLVVDAPLSGAHVFKRRDLLQPVTSTCSHTSKRVDARRRAHADERRVRRFVDRLDICAIRVQICEDRLVTSIGILNS